ncbi:MAG: hypothetical protein ISR65_11685 [Bacteriovoracaceae bacterium]|nr:hypothetical protein [Bacteriovoracaceae bacterium]
MKNLKVLLTLSSIFVVNAIFALPGEIDHVFDNVRPVPAKQSHEIDCLITALSAKPLNNATHGIFSKLVCNTKKNDVDFCKCTKVINSQNKITPRDVNKLVEEMRSKLLRSGLLNLEKQYGDLNYTVTMSNRSGWLAPVNVKRLAMCTVKGSKDLQEHLSSLGGKCDKRTFRVLGAEYRKIEKDRCKRDGVNCKNSTVFTEDDYSIAEKFDKEFNLAKSAGAFYQARGKKHYGDTDNNIASFTAYSKELLASSNVQLSHYFPQLFREYKKSDDDLMVEEFFRFRTKDGDDGETVDTTMQDKAFIQMLRYHPFLKSYFTRVDWDKGLRSGGFFNQGLNRLLADLDSSIARPMRLDSSEDIRDGLNTLFHKILNKKLFDECDQIVESYKQLCDVVSSNPLRIDDFLQVPFKGSLSRLDRIQSVLAEGKSDQAKTKLQLHVDQLYCHISQAGGKSLLPIKGLSENDLIPFEKTKVTDKQKQQRIREQFEKTEDEYKTPEGYLDQVWKLTDAVQSFEKKDQVIDEDDVLQIKRPTPAVSRPKQATVQVTDSTPTRPPSIAPRRRKNAATGSSPTRPPNIAPRRKDKSSMTKSSGIVANSIQSFNPKSIRPHYDYEERSTNLESDSAVSASRESHTPSVPTPAPMIAPRRKIRPPAEPVLEAVTDKGPEASTAAPAAAKVVSTDKTTPSNEATGANTPVEPVAPAVSLSPVDQEGPVGVIAPNTQAPVRQRPASNLDITGVTAAQPLTVYRPSPALSPTTPLAPILPQDPLMGDVNFRPPSATETLGAISSRIAALQALQKSDELDETQEAELESLLKQRKVLNSQIGQKAQQQIEEASKRQQAAEEAEKRAKTAQDSLQRQVDRLEQSQAKAGFSKEPTAPIQTLTAPVVNSPTEPTTSAAPIETPVTEPAVQQPDNFREAPQAHQAHQAPIAPTVGRTNTSAGGQKGTSGVALRAQTSQTVSQGGATPSESGQGYATADVLDTLKPLMGSGEPPGSLCDANNKTKNVAAMCNDDELELISITKDGQKYLCTVEIAQDGSGKSSLGNCVEVATKKIAKKKQKKKGRRPAVTTPVEPEPKPRPNRHKVQDLLQLMGDGTKQ